MKLRVKAASWSHVIGLALTEEILYFDSCHQWKNRNYERDALNDAL